MSPHAGRLSSKVIDAASVPPVSSSLPAVSGAPGSTSIPPILPSSAAAAKAARVSWVERDATYRLLLALADALSAAGALLLAGTAVSNGRATTVMLATVPLIVIMSRLIGTYGREDLLVRKSTLDEAPALFQLATWYALAVWLIGGFPVGGAADRQQLLVLWIALFLLLLLFRAAARAVSRLVTSPERCLVIGDTATCEWMRAKLSRRRSLHVDVVASAAPGRLEPPQHGVTAPLDAEDLGVLVSGLGIDRIIITAGGADEHGVIGLVHAASSLGLKVSVLPRVLELVGPSAEFDDVEGARLLSMRPLGLTRSSRLVKRLVDVVGSGFGLLVLGPLLAGIAVAIKLDSDGPVFFRQGRIGRDGTSFEMLKFRTMVQGADEQKHELRHLNQSTGLFKIAKDPRMTRVGSLIRRTSLDELPQLLNVFRGEMSLVGPRPLITEEDRLIEGWHRRRLHLTPGMTGHWQVLGSARIPLDEMVRIDYLYVTNWSLWLDVKILLRTIPYVLSGKGL